MIHNSAFFKIYQSDNFYYIGYLAHLYFTYIILWKKKQKSVQNPFAGLVTAVFKAN